MAISLSAGVRQSLQSLTSTAALAQTAQQRLATGKKVNSAIDNPVNFFTAGGLNNRADTFSGLLDGISNSIQTIKAASTGIDGITKLVKSLQATVKQALSDSVPQPLKTGSALATSAEATATGKSLKETALDKLIVDDNGATANTATASYSGNLGISATGSITLASASGSQTATFTSTATSTLRDFVNFVNTSGIATATVTDEGKLSLTGAGPFTLNAGGTAGANNTSLGFLATDSVAATAIGTAGNGAATPSATRATLVKQFNDTRDQITQLAKDSGFNGINLLAGDSLKTTFNEKTGAAQSSQTVQGSQINADTLGIVAARSGGSGTAPDFQSNIDLNSVDSSLTTALSSLSSLASSLGASLSVVQARQDFSKSLIDVLRIGADNLVNADTNEEGANLLALQTRQQLSQTALSLSSQADQSVLRLF